MKELPDSEFDRRLKEKSESFDFQFEEEAWTLMENKLRRRDRFVLFRNTGMLLLLLLLAGSGYFLLKEDKSSYNIARKNTPEKSIRRGSSDARPVKEVPANKQLSARKGKVSSKILYEARAKKETRANRLHITGNSNDQNNTSLAASNTQNRDLATIAHIIVHTDDTLRGELAIAREVDEEPVVQEGQKRAKTPVLFSLTFAAGPDYSSIESVKGRKATLNTGLLLNIGLKKLTLSTGLRYGVKDYAAEAYDYSLANPSRASSISGIDASCNVLEVPLQAYYPVFSNSKGRIELSAGLSSYFMLKEEYLFKYTPQSGYNDYLLKKENANRHFLSVLNLSTVYKFRPSKKRIQMGIEPYLKLPLGGVGEGKVKLKSSGVLLNASYGISKKK